MKCDFNFCVYNQNFECYLNEVGIDALGMCKQCTVVSLQEECLEKYKTEQLQKILCRYRDSKK